MVYPSCLVLLPLTDLPAVVPQGSANTSGSMCGAQQGQAAHRDPAISSVTLTPPTSPEEAQAGEIRSGRLLIQRSTPGSQASISVCTDYQLAQRWPKLSSASDGYSSNNTLHGGKIPRRMAGQMVETVWQEYHLNRTGHKYVWAWFPRKRSKSASLLNTCTASVSNRRKFPTLTNGTSEEEPDRTGIWDFVDSTHGLHCNCLRYV